ncbi:hypothetical protein AVEN_142697-1, partial [Araneus ventricosus]
NIGLFRNEPPPIELVVRWQGLFLSSTLSPSFRITPDGGHLT